MNVFTDPAALEAVLKLIGLGTTVVDLAVQAVHRRTHAAALARKAARPRRGVARKSGRRLAELRRLRQRHTKAATRPTGRRSMTRRARRVGPASRRP